MTSKIMIDVDERLTPTIRLHRAPRPGPNQIADDFDVRDRLIDHFYHRAEYVIVDKRRHPGMELYAASVMEVLEDIRSKNSTFFADTEQECEFNEALYKAMSLLEGKLGIKSTAFEEKNKAQALESGQK